jgi:hypothetical protein
MAVTRLGLMALPMIGSDQDFSGKDEQPEIVLSYSLPIRSGTEFIQKGINFITQGIKTLVRRY